MLSYKGGINYYGGLWQLATLQVAIGNKPVSRDPNAQELPSSRPNATCARDLETCANRQTTYTDLCMDIY